MLHIKVLGTGCPKCQKLYEETQQAAFELGLQCHIEKVTDMREILGYGVLLTPALVVEGQVLFSGKVPSRDNIKKLLG
jgi:small redox-active disulfide protein 2